jgi:pyruvate-formate lyase-activating enzyme
LIVKAKTLNKEVILYTNILNLEESFINVLDKIVVDIKGFDADYISKICKIDYLLALSLINKYHRHKQNDKFLFRINRKLFKKMNSI